MSQDKSGHKELTFQLFEKQRKIYPRHVSGHYRKLKWIVLFVTLGVYYLAPFLRWDRGPNVPDQAILIDLLHGRAYFFSIEIWPQEVYYLTGLLILAAIILFFITSLFGRVWCGYLCPQTVWTDLYIWVERLVQGDRNARKRLYDAPWSFEKVRKLFITHVLWLLIALLTGGAFVLYFNDAPTLMQDLFHLELTPTVIVFILSLTLSTYIMAGFGREQVCIFVCPYARFQSAMFDEDTLIIGYDEHRGEARGKHKKGDTWEGRGHCIDCTACVQACPMGIDIREGLQMECIACGLCIDACNNIMDKIELPRGLIRYDTERYMALSAKGIKKKFRILRPRTVYYMLIIAAVCAVMLVALLNRSTLDLTVLHDRNPLFVQLSDGSIRNGYEIKIVNKTHKRRVFRLELSGLDEAEIDVKAAGDIDADHLSVLPDSVGRYKIFVKAPIKADLPRNITFTLIDLDNDSQDSYESIFITKRPKR